MKKSLVLIRKMATPEILREKDQETCLPRVELMTRLQIQNQKLCLLCQKLLGTYPVAQKA